MNKINKIPCMLAYNSAVR